MSQTAALYHLQTLDSQIDEIRDRLAEIERTLNEDDTVRAARTTLESSETQQRDWRQKQAALEQERAHLQDEATETETRLYSGNVHNPRELTDLQDKLAELSHRRKELEEPILEAMMQVEELDKAIAAQEKALDQALAARAAEASELGVERDGLSKRLAELEGQSQEARREVEPAGLSLYDKLRKRPGGVSVVMIKGSECGACGVELTTQVIQQVRRGETLACPTCGRILFI